MPIPPLTEERRRDLVKGVKQMSEEARVRIRSARRDAMDAIKKMSKEGGITEDAVESYEKEVQKLTDAFVKKVDDATVAKEADIMKV
jgi:ribosome recycling factor